MDFKNFYEKFISYQTPEKITDNLPSFTYKQIDKKTGEAIRGRVVELILYPDDLSHCRALKAVNDLGYLYGANIHDRDLCDEVSLLDEFDDDDLREQFLFENQTDDGLHKKAHVHCVIYFSEAKTNTAVAKIFRISSNTVRVYKGQDALDRRVRYLCHLGENTKFQYDELGCCGPLARELKNLNRELGLTDGALLYDFLHLLRDHFERPQFRHKIITSNEILFFAYDQGYIRCCIKANLNVHVNNFKNDHNERVRSDNNNNNNMR